MSAPLPTLRRRLLGALATLAPWLLRPLFAALRASVRVQEVGGEALRARWARGEPVILAFWHNRLLVLPVIAAGQRVAILISQHRDGDLGAGLLAAWGVGVVRGSATRGGVGGLLRLVRTVREGTSVVILPDGPRGPRYVAKGGVVQLARLTGVPIVPITYAASRVWRLGSWDQLVLPLPFARFEVAVGAPIAVPADADAAELERRRAEVETSLRDLTRAVEARAGWPADALLAGRGTL